jgi:hypothetical protein
LPDLAPRSLRVLVLELERLRKENLRMLEELKELRGRKCIICSCTDIEACEGGCSWAEEDWESGTGICTNCANQSHAR